jgi:hypothetical protein
MALSHLQETDFAAVQNQLKAPARTGVGKELQNRCGESNQALTDWINSMEKPQHCKAKLGLTLESSALQRSGRFQCGAWCVPSSLSLLPSVLLTNFSSLLRCIFDLTTPDYAGWSYNGQCFTPFDDKQQGWCKQYVFILSSSSSLFAPADYSFPRPRFWSGRPAGVNLPKDTTDSPALPPAPAPPKVVEVEEEEEDDEELSVPAVSNSVDDEEFEDDEDDDDEEYKEDIVVKPVPKPVYKPKVAPPPLRKGLKQRLGAVA